MTKMISPPQQVRPDQANEPSVPIPVHKHQFAFKGEIAVCVFCGCAPELKTNKPYKPRSSAYITEATVRKILAKEPPRHSLCLELIFKRGLRASECLGDSKKPGIRPSDIDAEHRPEWRCNHTLRIWRKRGKFKILPLPDDLYDKIQIQIKQFHIKENERIFPYHRTTVYAWLAKYGQCVDERYKIGIHVLRRSFGKEFRRRGGKIEELQQIYSHTRMGQTMEYIGEDEDTAMSNLARMDKEK